MILEILNLDLLKINVSQVIPLFEKHRIVLLNGEMGVGKTTFIQEVLRQLNIDSLEGSPTYSLINEYHSESFGKIFHMDLYRLNNVEEAYDIGLEEILDGKNLCLIEWPEKITSFLQGAYLQLDFSLEPDLSRKVVVKEKYAN